jgi:ribosomal-protein-alanine N-acetyltransferase
VSITRRALTLPEPDQLHVRIAPMRRRNLRGVLRIEEQVYPRPWSHAVFQGEIATKDGSRLYVVARVGSAVVGYAGVLYQGDDAHVTNIAVDPAHHRHFIGSRLLLTLARQARARGSKHLTLEVRVSNRGAQALYRRFGFAPAGIRQKYYENVEDAIIMWAHDIDASAYRDRLAAIEDALPGTTAWEGLG